MPVLTYRHECKHLVNYADSLCPVSYTHLTQSDASYDCAFLAARVPSPEGGPHFTVKHVLLFSSGHPFLAARVPWQALGCEGEMRVAF